MGVRETLILYLVVGLVVAAAMVVARGARFRWLRQSPELLLWTAFWPLFAPLLLGRAAVAPRVEGLTEHPRIDAARARLVDALDRVDGVARAVVAPERERVEQLGRALSAMNRRRLEMDTTLAADEFDPAQIDAALADLRDRGAIDTDARVQSVTSRRRNIERLRALRDRTEDDIERALLDLEDLASQVALLRFAERPGVEVVDRIRELAANIEAITEGVGDVTVQTERSHR